jgi:UPF0755 protein
MRRALALAFVFALVAGGVLALGARALRRPADRDGAERVFEVAPHESLEKIAHRLDDAGLLPHGLVPSAPALVFWATVTQKDRAIKCGEYDLSPAQTPLEILAKLVSGKVKMHEVTLPEGLRLDEIAHRLSAAHVTDAGAFLERATDAELAHSLGLEADSFEGYAFPETYRFRRDTPAQEVLSRMLEELRSRISEDDRVALARSGFTLHQVVTLASIVERETAQPSERPLVASVYLNRLRIGMRLQSDPTVIYGVLRTRGAFDGDLRVVDLHEDNPWNTYTRAGLPPGPIANPSIESIRAVLRPADSRYLYFVSRNDGSHEFSETLTEHNRAVKRYQLRRQARVEARTDDGRRH